MALIGISGKIGSGKDLVGTIIQYLYYIKSDIHEGRKVSFEVFTKTHMTNNLLISQNIPKIVKYADKLKDIVCILLGCTREQLEDRVYKETELGEEWWYWKSNVDALDNIQVLLNTRHPYIGHEHINIKATHYQLIKLTPRLLLQLIGTECGRQIIHPNVWVNATMSSYRPYGYEEGNNKNVADVLEDIHFNTLNYPNWLITDVRFPNEADAIKQRKGINIRLQRGGDSDIDNNVHESETALDLYKFDYVVCNHGTIEELILMIKEILIKEKII